MRGLAEIKRDNAAARPTAQQALLVTVGCTHCGGTGLRALSRAEWTTLDAVTFGWTPTPEIRARLGTRISPAAIVNRLVGLQQIGLVEGRRSDDHRVKEWRRIR